LLEKSDNFACRRPGCNLRSESGGLKTQKAAETAAGRAAVVTGIAESAPESTQSVPPPAFGIRMLGHKPTETAARRQGTVNRFKMQAA